MLELNKIYCGDCLSLFSKLDKNTIDLIVTSPPYNVGIKYDNWDDKLSWGEYVRFTKYWLGESWQVLKSDGRIAINIPYEINYKENGYRKLIIAEYYNIMKDIGFHYNGMVDLKEIQPHRVKYTAWGSWLSPSAPYIYNAKECVLLFCKEQWKKSKFGSMSKSYFDESDEKKKEFINLCSGEWDYFAETKKLTEANYAISIPENAIKILTYENDIVLDPFMGSGTTAVACKKLNRNYVGFEISQNYVDIANNRINNLSEELEIF
jgi:site-specific DNA-methyltransferase (adenine-specific)